MRTLLAVLAMSVATAGLEAQDTTPNPRPEIGFRGGVTFIQVSDDFGGDNTFTVISLPNSTPPWLEPLHLTYFVSPRFAVEPQLAFMRISSSNGSGSMTHAGLQLNRFLGDPARSAYVFALVAALRQADETDSETETAFGIGIGHRTVHNETVAVRYELRLRQWDLEFSNRTEVSALIGIGAIIP